MGALTKLLVDEPVFSCQCLDVFSQLSYLLSLQLGDLCLLIELLPQVLTVRLKILDLLLALIQLAQVVVLTAYSHTHLMLHIAELKALLLQLLLGLHKLLCFLVELALHLIEIRVKHGDTLL